MRLRHRFCMSADIGSFSLPEVTQSILMVFDTKHQNLIILRDPGAVSRGSAGKARRTFPSTSGRAPGYRHSPDHFQTVKRMVAPDWAQKMLCIIVPNRRTASPEFFCNFKTRLVCEICSSDVNMHKGYLLLACLKSKSRFLDV